MTSPGTHAALMQADSTVQLLIRLVGEKAAVRLMDVKKLGGRRFRFPKSETRLGAQSFAYLAEIVGMDKAQVLCRHFGGDDVYIPKMTQMHILTQHRRIVTAYNNGTSINELVREFGLSDRHIWRVLKKTDMTVTPTLDRNPQSSLFD